jgi:hypothetical protein
MGMGMSKVKPKIRPLLYNQEEAAAALGVSVDFFHEQIQDNLPYVPIGRPDKPLKRWRPETIDEWLKEHERPAPERKAAWEEKLLKLRVN